MAASIVLHPDYEEFLRDFFICLDGMTDAERNEFRLFMRSLAVPDEIADISPESIRALAALEAAGCPWDRVNEAGRQTSTG